MEKEKTTYIVRISGTFSVETGLDNLNYPFVKALAPDEDILISLPWDGSYELERLVMDGRLVGHNLYNVPGIIRKADWVAATDTPYSKRKFFHIEGSVKFHDIDTASEFRQADAKTEDAVRNWMTAVGNLIHRVDGVVWVGSRILMFEHASDSEYERTAEWVREGMAPLYRFFPDAATPESMYIGEPFMKADTIRQIVDKYYKDIPVRCEVTDDGGLTWETYSIETNNN